jgi:[acyl-carrier-protein] S-malonyltransferase
VALRTKILLESLQPWGTYRAAGTEPSRLVLVGSAKGDEALKRYLVCGGQGTSTLRLDRVPDIKRFVRDGGSRFRRYLENREVHLGSLAPTEVQPLFVMYQVASAYHAERLGTRVDAVLAQSLGEISAAVVTGAISLDDGLALASARADLPLRLLRQGCWLMVACDGLDVCQARSLAENHESHVAAINSPRDVIMSGERGAVEATVAAAGLAEGRSRPLPIAAPYHTPHMAPVRRYFQELIAVIEVSDPRLPIMSATAGRLLSTAEDVRDALVRTLTSPVDWASALNGAVVLGGREFLDCGPGSGLARLVWKNKLEVAWASLDAG